MNILEL